MVVNSSGISTNYGKEQINQLVYHLYDMIIEEVQIIEESFKD